MMLTLNHWSCHVTHYPSRIWKILPFGFHRGPHLHRAQRRGNWGGSNVMRPCRSFGRLQARYVSNDNIIYDFLPVSSPVALLQVRSTEDTVSRICSCQFSQLFNSCLVGIFVKNFFCYFDDLAASADQDKLSLSLFFLFVEQLVAAVIFKLIRVTSDVL